MRRWHFRFEECWTLHQECGDIVRNNGNWKTSGDSFSPLHKNLFSCSKELGRWGKNILSNRKHKIKKCKSALQDAYSEFPKVDFTKIHAIEFELDSLLEEEEIYWKQRSRENWLQWGDHNTKWFHKKTSFRKNKNEIKGILNSFGQWTEDPKTIENTFCNYFQNLFTLSNLTNTIILEVLQTVKPRVDKSMNDSLLALFNSMEVENAVAQMFPTKALGPYGFPAMFYQNFWNIVE